MKQNKKILDYGCGWGGNYKFIAKRGEYIGIDIGKEMIDVAQKRYTAGKFIYGDGSTIPYSDKYFDEIHAYDVLEHVKNFTAVLDELDRVLQPGGALYIVVPARVSEKVLSRLKPEYFVEVGHERIVDPVELKRILSEKGYELRTMKKSRGVEALVYAWLFWWNKNERHVAHQTGSPEFSRWLVAFIWIFDTRLFITPLKYFFFIYWITLPIGWLVSRFFPKSVYAVFQKKTV